VSDPQPRFHERTSFGRAIGAILLGSLFGATVSAIEFAVRAVVFVWQVPIKGAHTAEQLLPFGVIFTLLYFVLSLILWIMALFIMVPIIIYIFGKTKCATYGLTAALVTFVSSIFYLYWYARVLGRVVSDQEDYGLGVFVEKLDMHTNTNGYIILFLVFVLQNVLVWSIVWQTAYGRKLPAPEFTSTRKCSN
jgi:hypothetical protein